MWMLSLRATLHCLLGCSLGEVAGTAIGSSLGWHPFMSALLATALAFVSGYALSVFSLRSLPLKQAFLVALASDTVSITVMELADNAVSLLFGAPMKSVSSGFFWGSMLFALAAGFLAAWPVNRFLIARGMGHAHHGGPHHGPHES